MTKQKPQTIIVTATIQRCCECGWSMSPTILAHNEQLHTTGFFCLDCYAEASNRGDLDPRKEVTL